MFLDDSAQVALVSLYVILHAVVTKCFPNQRVDNTASLNLHLDLYFADLSIENARGALLAHGGCICWGRLHWVLDGGTLNDLELWSLAAFLSLDSLHIFNVSQIKSYECFQLAIYHCVDCHHVDLLPRQGCEVWSQLKSCSFEERLVLGLHIENW